MRDAFLHQTQPHHVPVGRPDRFLPHCLQRDPEALLLAAAPARFDYPGLATSSSPWPHPEDIGGQQPPKRRVEELFRRRHRSYDPINDAPAILRRADLAQVCSLCPCFASLVEDLRRVLAAWRPPRRP